MEHARAKYVVSARRACRVVRQWRGTQRYQPLRRTDEEELTQAILALATKYGRYGDRRITGLRQNAGWRVGQDRVQRIWRREGLKVPQKPRPRGRLWLHEGSCIRLRPERANPVWSYDFVKGRPHGGRALRILVLIDEYTRECLALSVARRLGRLLTDLINPIIGNDTLFNAAKFVPPNREGPTATSSTKPEVTGVMGIVCQLGTADEQSLQPKPWV